MILEPAAVLDIVGFMFWDYSGVAILDQRSFLNDRIGTKLFGENINIRDDAFRIRYKLDHHLMARVCGASASPGRERSG